ncbi:MAG: polysaccharide biosynthesis protein, partial [Bacteroidota bacterium]
MDIKGKTVLVLGGWGLVGSAICRKFMEERPRRIIVTSLKKSEALDAVKSLQKDFPRTSKGFFIPWWGNIFVREQLKDIPRGHVLGTPKYRAMLLEDTTDELTAPVLRRSSLYRLMQKYKPD